MSHFSPLLWLCAVSAAALNSFTSLDPTGAYEQYLDALGENTPAIAAFFDAAESGVFPWTIPGVSEPIPSPVPDLLPQPPEVVDPVIPDEPEEPVSQFTTVDASYFDDALFLGDSHTNGFHDYAGLGNATYFTKNGLTVKDAMEKSSSSWTAKRSRSPRRSARGSSARSISSSASTRSALTPPRTGRPSHKSLLDLVREKQPDAVIFIQSIFHTTQKKSDSSYFKNEVINERNAAIAQLADGKTIFYLDLNPLFDDENGALCADYSGDGVHVRAPYYVQWRDHLYRFGVVK